MAYRLALLILSLLACACTAHDRGAPADSALTADTPAMNDVASEGVPPDEEVAPELATSSEKDEASPPPAETRPAPEPPRRLLQVPPEYRKAQALYGDARRALKAGDEEKASALLDEVLTLRADHAPAVRDKLALCRSRGEYEEALFIVEKALARRPRDANFIYEKALTQFEMKRPGDALTTLTVALDPERPFPAARLLQMKALASIGDRNGTLTALEAAADAGFTDVAMVKGEPLLELVAGDPRFQAAIGEMERNRGARPVEVPLLHDFPRRTATLEDVLWQVRSNRQRGTGWDAELDLEDLDGKRARLEDYRGKPLILCVWGTWSLSSRKALPDLAKLAENHRKEKLEVLLLAWENHVDPTDPGDVRRFLERRKIHLRCAILKPEDLKKMYVQGCPNLFFVDPEGKIETYIVGHSPLEELETVTKAFLEGGK